jgi:hypothetical protein
VEREQIDEFSLVRDAALDAVRLGACIDRNNSGRVCQLLVLPSFENLISWDVIKVVSRQSGPQNRLYRSCWRMDLDYQAFRSPVERVKHPRPFSPTFEKDWVPIDSANLEAILSRLRSIRIPLSPASQVVGADGTSFELEIHDLFCYARIRWWCDMPEDWRELEPVVTDLLRLFQSSWDQSHG